MLKKISCFCIALCMTFSLMVPAQTQAQSKTQSKINSISSDTIITKDNILKVLEYLNIDSNNFTETSVTEKSVYTVGELEKVIEQAKKPIEIKEKVETNSNSIFVSSLVPNLAPNLAVTSMASASVGTIMLYSTLNVGSSYTLQYQVAGQYNYGTWTGATSADVSVDSSLLIPVYKIDSKQFTISYTSTQITLNSNVVVGTYAGVGDFGVVEILSTPFTGIRYWYTQSIPGWHLVSGTWYFYENSAKVTGWDYIGSSWYHFNSSGAMETGWLSVGGYWYYLNSSGAMQTGWVLVGGKSYYLYSDGHMAVSTTTPDGYIVGADGAWIH